MRKFENQCFSHTLSSLPVLTHTHTYTHHPSRPGAALLKYRGDGRLQPPSPPKDSLWIRQWFPPPPTPLSLSYWSRSSGPLLLTFYIFLFLFFLIVIKKKKLTKLARKGKLSRKYFPGKKKRNKHKKKKTHRRFLF